MSLVVWVAAPTGRDSELVAGVLRESGVKAAISNDLSSVGPQIHENAGAVVVAEEALNRVFIQHLRTIVSEQPTWSDLPVLILTGTAGQSPVQQLEYQQLGIGSPVLLERPILTENLLSSVQAALRARQRQFDMRDTLRERDRALAELKQERETLQVTAADLLRSTERFRRLIEHASVGLIIGDFDGGISYANPAILHLLGYTADEVESLPLRWNDLTPHEYAAADRKAMAELRSEGNAKSYQKVYRAKDGRLIPLLIGATIIPVEQGETEANQVAVFITDLTSQKQAESALIQSEKLAAVGRLAASISHEINNPLEAVTNLLYLARMERETPERVRSLLDTAGEELQRVSQITAQTLRFHRQSTNARVVRLEELLQGALMLYKGRLLNAQIQVEEQHRGALPVTCFDGDIRQVFNNMIGNAIDAMRSGGRLVIRTSNAWMQRAQMPGVRISIGDTGQGMSPEVRQRIYEPFYTTKGLNGSGLGLWISRGIIQKHFGHLQVRSRVGPGKSGTVFSIQLPVMHEKLSRTNAR